jgi:hypothetical protein
LYVLAVLKPLLGVMFVAAVATLGDHVWDAVGARNEATAGSLHGAALLGAVGLVLGWISRRLVAGLLTGMAAGVGGALAYYAIASAMGGRGQILQAMVAAWAAVWIVLAICDARVLRRPAVRPWSDALMRGVAAAVIGGIAFYLMYPYFWGREARNYGDLVKFGAWMVAWAPGIFSLTLRARERT